MQKKHSKTPDISIVVPAYNEERYISSCLKALTTQKTKASYEIIVVDNNSTDKTVQVAKKFRVTLLHEKKKGYAEAARHGVHHAKAAIIAMTDADTRPNKHWIDTIDKTFRDNPQVIALGGPYEFYDGPLMLRLAIKTINRWAPQLLAASLCGMNMAYRKSAYTAIGGYAPHINLQADTHLGLRLFRHGQVVYLSKNTVSASARRYTNVFQGTMESSLRVINVATLKMFGRPMFFSQTDIR